ncbi:hypothetical protein BDZ89DRAFT_508771 [Hymenopellis radicata]|nr:hypothetical protein BDZ89DRAFT_508771 [Hymenopellis radicata]
MNDGISLLSRTADSSIVKTLDTMSSLSSRLCARRGEDNPRRRRPVVAAPAPSILAPLPACIPASPVSTLLVLSISTYIVAAPLAFFTVEERGEETWTRLGFGRLREFAWMVLLFRQPIF